jgi:hypothetical protein
VREIKRVTVSQGQMTSNTVGDIWPTAWADDDDLYTAACDTTGNPAGMYRRGRATPVDTAPPGDPSPGRNVAITRLAGDPDAPRLTTLNPMEPLLAMHGYDGAVGSWKASGMLAHDGVLYLTAFHHRYCWEVRAFPWWTGTHPAVLVSRDYGASWSSPTDALGVEDPYRFGSPSFVQFGRDGADHQPEYVYLVSPGEGRWTNNDTYLLARARADAIEWSDRWEYWHGEDDLGGWGSIRSATPIIEAPMGLGCGPEVVYIAQLDSYVLLTFSAPDLPTGPATWQEAAKAHDRTLLHVYQAEQLAGPWRSVYSGRGPGQNDYCPRLPLKWVSADGLTAHLISAGNFLNSSDMPLHYGLVISRIEFEVGG